MPAETRQVGRIDHLRMFDPPAPVALIGLCQFVDRVEHLGIGLVADRVDGDLVLVHRRTAHEVADHVVRHEAQPGLAGGIGIGLFEPRTRDPSAPSPYSFTPTSRSLLL